MTTLIISNEWVIAKSASKSIENEAKERKRGFLRQVPVSFQRRFGCVPSVHLQALMMKKKVEVLQ